MTINQARAAALLLQQELLDLDCDDVVLKIEHIKKPVASPGAHPAAVYTELEEVNAVELALSFEGRNTAFYVDEHGKAWGNSDSWGVTFADNTAWKFDQLAKRVNDRLPALTSVKFLQSALLNRLIKKTA